MAVSLIKKNWTCWKGESGMRRAFGRPKLQQELGKGPEKTKVVKGMIFNDTAMLKFK